jgi:RNA polymerase sigma-54 factor
VKEIIREIIGQDGAGGLSDQKIVEVLAARGVSLARRTVAKYRGELAIDSSYLRRRT